MEHSRFITTTPTSTRLSVRKRSQITRLAARTLPLVEEPGSIRRLVLAMCISAQGCWALLARVTPATSEAFSDKRLPAESRSFLALKPVTFRYKHELDPEGIAQFGLVAEEVEKVSPDLVIRGTDGKAYTVRYEAVNPMLLNEFLKEHREVEQMQKQVETLTMGLRKVSAQLEVSKPAQQTVLNNK